MSGAALKLEATGEFKRDIRDVDAAARARIDAVVHDVSSRGISGTKLRDERDVFALRIESRRLVYHAKDGTITLLFFKNREQVYDYLH